MAPEQNAERHCKVEYRQEQADVFPASMQPLVVPDDFFRKISRPDDEPLRKIEISP